MSITTASDFHFTTIGDQIRRGKEGAVTKWLLDGIIIEAGSHLIYAAPGHGKSIISMALGIAATHGKKWLGIHSFDNPIPILYLDDDGNNDHEFNSRLLQFGAAEDNPYFHCLLHNNFNITDATQRESLIKWCLEKGIRLLIADSLTRLHSKTESSADEMKIVNACIKEFCAAGIAVVMLHHSIKSGRTFRGSSEISSAYDSVFRMEKRSDTRFAIYNEKIRSVAETGIWPGCEIEIETDEEDHIVLDGSLPLSEGNEAHQSSKTNSDTMRERIIDFLSAEDMHATGLKNALKLSSRHYSALDACIETLVDDGQTSPYAKGKATYYSLCASSDDEIEDEE